MTKIAQHVCAVKTPFLNLTNLYELGLLKGSEVNGEMEYNLSKITHANDGAVDPDLLAPGLD